MAKVTPPQVRISSTLTLTDREKAKGIAMLRIAPDIAIAAAILPPRINSSSRYGVIQI